MGEADEGAGTAVRRQDEEQAAASVAYVAWFLFHAHQALLFSKQTVYVVASCIGGLTNIRFNYLNIIKENLTKHSVVTVCRKTVNFI